MYTGSLQVALSLTVFTVTMSDESMKMQLSLVFQEKYPCKAPGDHVH
jgi:hypothetical protein